MCYDFRQITSTLRHICIALLYLIDLSYSFYKEGA